MAVIRVPPCEMRYVNWGVVSRYAPAFARTFSILISLSLYRMYNSLHLFYSPLGYLETHTHTIRVFFLEASPCIILSPDNYKLILFPVKGSWRFLFFSNMYKNIHNSFTVKHTTVRWVKIASNEARRCCDRYILVHHQFYIHNATLHTHKCHTPGIFFRSFSFKTSVFNQQSVVLRSPDADCLWFHFVYVNYRVYYIVGFMQHNKVSKIWWDICECIFIYIIRLLSLATHKSRNRNFFSVILLYSGNFKAVVCELNFTV